MASTPLTRLAQVLPKQKGPRFALALAAVLVLRSRLLELPQEVLAGVFERTARKHKLSPEELSETLQRLYVKEEDGRKMLLVPHREGVSKVRLRKFCDLSPSPSFCENPLERGYKDFGDQGRNDLACSITRLCRSQSRRFLHRSLPPTLNIIPRYLHHTDRTSIRPSSASCAPSSDYHSPHGTPSTLR